MGSASLTDSIVYLSPTFSFRASNSDFLVPLFNEDNFGGTAFFCSGWGSNTLSGIYDDNSSGIYGAEIFFVWCNFFSCSTNNLASLGCFIWMDWIDLNFKPKGWSMLFFFITCPSWILSSIACCKKFNLINASSICSFLLRAIL